VTSTQPCRAFCMLSTVSWMVAEGDTPRAFCRPSTLMGAFRVWASSVRTLAARSAMMFSSSASSSGTNSASCAPPECLWVTMGPSDRPVLPTLPGPEAQHQSVTPNERMRSAVLALGGMDQVGAGGKVGHVLLEEAARVTHHVRHGDTSDRLARRAHDRYVAAAADGP